MTGPAWLIDSKRIASKIKNASGTLDSSRFKWKSNPTKACPQCKHIIDNTDVSQEWPGLPKGVKFDPSDQELLWHLLAKAGKGEAKPHPFINEFIPTVDEDDGICYTHPRKLPGVKQDGSVSHFFHRTFKAYNTGTRKRRKIHDDLGDIRWHKTGKTKPVIIDGEHLGCKKIMVLYMSLVKGEKPEKTNWVMHQYHLGTGEDEQEGQFVVSKIFCQQPQVKPSDFGGRDSTPIAMEDVIVELEPVFGPNLEAFEHHEHSPGQISEKVELYHEDGNVHPELYHEDGNVQPEIEKLCEQQTREEANTQEDTKWWEGESQFLLDSQQLAEGIALCDEFLQSQSSCVDDEGKRSKPSLSEYAHMDVGILKKDLEECRNMGSLDHANIELDTPPDLRLSQLEFGSQDSFLAWAGTKLDN